MAEKEICLKCGAVAGHYPLCEFYEEWEGVTEIQICRECGGAAGHDPCCPAGDVGGEPEETGEGAGQGSAES